MPTPDAKRTPDGWKRPFKWGGVGTWLISAIIGYAIEDDVRTLASVERV